MRVAVAAVLLLVALGVAPPRLAAAADRKSVQLDGGNTMIVEVFEGAPKWRVLPHLWSQKTINVTCPTGTEFSVYVADAPELLVERVKQRRAAWCGWASVFSWDSPSCAASVSPLRKTAVAVVLPRQSGPSVCTFQEEEHFSPLMVAQGVAGALLFLNAPALVGSMAFRLSAGTGGFMLLSAAILAFIIYRSVPNKKRMLAALAMFGSSLISAVRYFVGSWFPSLEDLVYNKWALLYTGASGLIGLAVTYYYDDPANTKLNTILQRGLELAGLAMVATSTSLPEASCTAAALLLLYRLAPALRVPRVPWLRQKVRQAASAVPAPSRARRAVQSAPGRMLPGVEATDSADYEGGDTIDEDEEGEQAGEEGEDPHTTPGARGRARPNGVLAASRQPAVSPLVERGLIYNEETGRTIQIGNITYRKLVTQGYQVDEQRGVMTPPTSGASSRRSGTAGRAPGSGRRRSGAPTSSGQGQKDDHLDVAAAMGLPDSSPGQKRRSR